MHNLFRNVQLIYRTTQVTGSTAANNYAGVDTRGYAGVGVLFVVNGTPTTGSIVSLQGDASSSGFGTAAAITGATITLSTAYTDGCAIIDLHRPASRWVRPVHTKTDTGDLLDDVVVFGYLPNYAPVTHSTADLDQAVYVYSV